MSKDEALEVLKTLSPIKEGSITTEYKVLKMVGAIAGFITTFGTTLLKLGMIQEDSFVYLIIALLIAASGVAIKYITARENVKVGKSKEIAALALGVSPVDPLGG